MTVINKPIVPASERVTRENQPVKTFTWPANEVHQVNQMFISILGVSDIGVSQEAVRGRGQEAYNAVSGQLENALQNGVQDASEAVSQAATHPLSSLQTAGDWAKDMYQNYAHATPASTQAAGDNNSKKDFNINRRKEKLISLIAMPMPQQAPSIGLKVNYATKEMGVAGMLVSGTANGGSISDLLESIKSNAFRGLSGSLATMADDATGNKLGDLNSVLQSATQSTYNPRLEQIYQNQDLRSFHFSWDMFASNKDECQLIMAIIKELRLCASPAIQQGQWYMIMPNELSIDFMFEGAENLMIPKINRSVIESVNVSFCKGSNFATLANGMPSYLTLDLGIIEIVPIFRKDIMDGF
jgi:hypothetical protein